VVRPGRKTGTRRGARRERAAMARVGWGGRASSAGGGGGSGRAVAVAAAAAAAAGAAVAAAAAVVEDILRTVSIVTS
jgi:hypothetical protein